MKKQALIPVIYALVLSSCSVNSLSSFDSSKDPTSSLNPISSSIETKLNAFQLNEPHKEFNTEKTTLNNDYVNAVQNFTTSFYQQIYNDKNHIFSPVSIATCFSMLYEGANGSSKEELKSLLNYDENLFNHLEQVQKMLLIEAINDEKEDTYLDIAQSLWIDESFKNEIKQTYVDILTNYYYAEAFGGVLKSGQMHEALANYINKKTNNFLEVKPEDFKDYGGLLWLLNTIYLKSKWSTQFDGSANKDGEFNNFDGSKGNVTYMNETMYGHIRQKEEYKISSLYLRNGICFNMLLPNEGSDYHSVLTSQSALRALYSFAGYSAIDSSIKRIHYQVPQFKEKQSYDLKDILLEMGVTNIFDEDLANLSGIAVLSNGNNIYVGNAKHEAGIAVDNEGIEAVAYTLIGVDEALALQDPPIEFVLDRPFAYCISDLTGIPLFVGVVNKL